jgi:dATP pyrophosphohydrolase
MRAPFQVLVLVFRRTATGEPEFALFKRPERTGGFWQPVTGGGEGSETPPEAARREALEEARIPPDRPLYELATRSSIPVYHFQAPHWPSDLYMIPEHAFAVDATGVDVMLSPEHTEMAWLGYDEARKRVAWDGNRSALWELRERLKNGHLTAVSAVTP